MPQVVVPHRHRKWPTPSSHTNVTGNVFHCRKCLALPPDELRRRKSLCAATADGTQEVTRSPPEVMVDGGAAAQPLEANVDGRTSTKTELPDDKSRSRTPVVCGLYVRSSMSSSQSSHLSIPSRPYLFPSPDPVDQSNSLCLWLKRRCQTSAT